MSTPNSPAPPMTREEFNKFYGDRLLGIFTRAYGEIYAIIRATLAHGEARLLDAGRCGEVMTNLMKDGLSLRDEIAKRLIPDPVGPAKPANGTPAPAPKKA